MSKGDQPETYWILTLSEPICVDDAHEDFPFNVAQHDIRKIQLVFAGNTEYRKYKKLVSKEVLATGTLYGSHTAHHYTDVLLTVAKLEKTK